MLLNIKDLVVTANGSIILDNFNLEIGPGEVHVLMGKNGAGKSTLAKVIMGDPNYLIKDGTITYKDEVINDYPVALRAKQGIFLTWQNPLSIEGITNAEMLKTALSTIEDKQIGLYQFAKELEEQAHELEFNQNLLHRSLNTDFSGGERKKGEILQMNMLKPELIILDEIDSGLDVDSLKIIGKNVTTYLKNNPQASCLVITHYPRLLEYIKPDTVHLLANGSIHKSGTAKLAKQIDESGFKENKKPKSIGTCVIKESTGHE